jgi:hypothetical protein
MSINGRSKGGRGERECCSYLKQLFMLDFDPVRNLEQTREGGADIINIPGFTFEVKRVEKLALRSWWLQVKKACTPGTIPVVIYRQNKQEWQGLISAEYIGLKYGFIQLPNKELNEWLLMQWDIIIGR